MEQHSLLRPFSEQINAELDISAGFALCHLESGNDLQHAWWVQVQHGANDAIELMFATHYLPPNCMQAP